MKQTRTILCFGDSNTYGAVPTLARSGRHRFTAERRWTGILRRQLGEGWDVIEEGHPSRTTVHDDPIEGAHKNGLKALHISLESHMPLDLVILMLGTNDLKPRFSVSAGDIAESIEVLIRAVQASEAGAGGVPPQVLVIAPPPIVETDWLADMFQGGAAKSADLGVTMMDAAKRRGAHFLDSGKIIEASSVDGIHLDVASHKILGGEIARTVLKLFPKS